MSLKRRDKQPLPCTDFFWGGQVLELTDLRGARFLFQTATSQEENEAWVSLLHDTILQCSENSHSPNAGRGPDTIICDSAVLINPAETLYANSLGFPPPLYQIKKHRPFPSTEPVFRIPTPVKIRKKQHTSLEILPAITKQVSP